MDNKLAPSSACLWAVEFAFVVYLAAVGLAVFLFG
jgi:hypothetical protein